MAERLSDGLRNGSLKPGGKSIADLLAGGVIDFFTGVQPASANDIETPGSIKLVRVTLNKGAFIAGDPTNGLTFGEPVSGVLPKNPAEIWAGEALADGQAGWFRFYDNAVITGASTEAVRLDGRISTSGAEINMSNLNIVLGGTTTVDGFNVTLPAA